MVPKVSIPLGRCPQNGQPGLFYMLLEFDRYFQFSTKVSIPLGRGAQNAILKSFKISDFMIQYLSYNSKVIKMYRFL